MNDAAPTTEPLVDHVASERDDDEWYAAFDGKDTLAFALTVLSAAGILVGSLLAWAPERSEFRSWFFENSAASLLLAIAIIVLAVVAYITVESWVAWVAAAVAAVVVGIAVTNIVDIYQASGDITPKFGLWWVLVDGIFAFVCSVWLAVGLLDRLID